MRNIQLRRPCPRPPHPHPHPHLPRLQIKIRPRPSTRPRTRMHPDIRRLDNAARLLRPQLNLTSSTVRGALYGFSLCNALQILEVVTRKAAVCAAEPGAARGVGFVGVLEGDGV